MVTSYALIVPLRLGETAKQIVASSGIGRTDLKVGRKDGNLYIPLQRRIDPPLAEGTVAMFDFEPARPPASYKDLVDVPAALRARLPSSFDIVGDLVVIKIPEELWAHRGEIGRALLGAHPNLRGVFHDEGVAGDRRLRRLEPLAGEPRTQTVHQEYGARFHVDLATAYFSPRLANEHRRVAESVQAGERFVDATAGVGPFVVQAALRDVSAEYVAIDVNPAAIELLRRNLELNRVRRAVDARVGDAQDVLPTLDPFHRVAINLPHGGEPILQAAWPRLVRGGTAHYYTIADQADADGLGKALLERLRKATGLAGQATAPRVVHPYSPRDRLYALDLTRD